MKSVNFAFLKKAIDESKNKKIIIYGTDEPAREIHDKLKLLGVDVAYFVDETAILDKLGNAEIREPEELLYEELTKIFVLVSATTYHCQVRIISKLEAMGLDSSSFLPVFKLKYFSKGTFYPDVALTYNRFDSNPLGFTVFGGGNGTKPFKIITLGGSATDAQYKAIRPWSDFLYEKLKADHIDVSVFCGGMAGYTSTQELLKLIRDVLALKPDLVISYSGFHDAYYSLAHQEDETSPLYKRPFIHEEQVNGKWFVSPEQVEKVGGKIHYGMQNDQSSALCWVDNMRNMHAICDEFNIAFYAFLEPSIYTGKYMASEQELRFIENLYRNLIADEKYQRLKAAITDFFSEARKAIQNIGYIRDFTGIFDNALGLYLDDCHVKEKGNQIIAENIYSAIKPFPMQ